MLRLTRYHLGHLWRLIASGAAILLAIIWLQQSLRFVDLIVNRGLSAWDFFWLTVQLLPSMLMFILPLAALVGTSLALKQWRDDNELDALYACGFGRPQLARAVIWAGCGVVGLGLLNNLYLAPLSKTAFKDTQDSFRQERSIQLLSTGAFNPLSDDLTLYLASRQRDGSLKGLMIHDHSTPGTPTTWFASAGAMTLTSQGQLRLTLDHGLRQTLTPAGLQEISFARHTLDINIAPPPTGPRWRDADERTWPELAPHLASHPADASKYLAERHKRLLWALTPLPLMVWAAWCLLPRYKNRRAQAWRMAAAIGFGLLYQGLLVTTHNAAEHGSQAALYGQWLLPLSTFALAWWGLNQPRLHHPRLAPV